jgi:hypothetical protein
MQIPTGHTRLPKYLQQRYGTIVQRLGEFPFADDRAKNASGVPNEALYSVEFQLSGHTVRADLFESYLEAML